jgi:hypothetical protein
LHRLPPAKREWRAEIVESRIRIETIGVVGRGRTRQEMDIAYLFSRRRFPC